MILFFAGPLAVLFSGGNAIAAGSLGYVGIALFVGGVAARYSFIEHPRPVVQLLLNTGIACLFSGVFYLVFLLLMLW